MSSNVFLCFAFSMITPQEFLIFKIHTRLQLLANFPFFFLWNKFTYTYAPSAMQFAWRSSLENAAQEIMYIYMGNELIFLEPK